MKREKTPYSACKMFRKLMGMAIRGPAFVKTAVLLVAVTALSLAVCPTSVKVWAKYLEVESRVNTKTKLTLSWEKHKLDGYDIYRASVNANGETGAFQKLASIDGKQTSLVCKNTYKKRYIFHVKGYRLKKGKKIYAYDGYATDYMGVSGSDWDEYQFCYAYYSPECIMLNFYVDGGLEPSGYEVYRSTDGKSFKKWLSSYQNGYSSHNWCDFSVSFGKTYYYKVRAFRDMDGARVYGKFSCVLERTAANQNGSYLVEAVTPDNSETGSLIIKLASDDKHNGTCLLNPAYSCHYKRSQGKAEPDTVDLIMTQYRYGQKKWTDFKDKNYVQIPTSQPIYLKFENMDTENGVPKPFLFAAADSTESVLDDIDIRYNGIDSILTIDLKNKAAKTEVNGEVYH